MSTHPEYLRDFSCFRDLSEEQLNAVAEFSNAVCYPPKHILFREGEKGKNLYFLVKGEVEVLYNIGSDDQVRVEMITDEEIAGCSAPGGTLHLQCFRTKPDRDRSAGD